MLPVTICCPTGPPRYKCLTIILDKAHKENHDDIISHEPRVVTELHCIFPTEKDRTNRDEEIVFLSNDKRRLAKHTRLQLSIRVLALRYVWLTARDWE